MAAGESSRTLRRAPAADRVGQSRSAFRLIAATRTRHPYPIALDAAVEIAAVLVLLEEGLECVEERHAALVEHRLYRIIPRFDRSENDREPDPPHGAPRWDGWRGV